MNIYIFSDYHAQEELLPEMRKRASEADLVISGGDHTIFGYHQDKILKEFNSWQKPVLLLHGNHEAAEDVAAGCKKYPNLTFTHAAEHVIGNVRILTWGGGGFSQYDKALAEQSKIWQRSKHMKLPTIFITHAPPYKTKLDLMPGNRHVGNKTIKETIKQLKPTIMTCGHIHDAEGAIEKIGQTTCYNLGPLGKVFIV